MLLKVHLLLGTNQFQPHSVEEIVSKFSEQPAQVITDENDESEDEESKEQITHLSKNEAGEAKKTLNRLSLFTEDSGFDSLISELTCIFKVKRILKLVMMLNISVRQLNVSGFH